MGLDPQESFAEVYEDGGVEDTVGVEVEIPDVVVPQQTLEEVAGRKRQSSLREPGEHGELVRVFSMGYGSPAAALHMSTSFSRRNPLLRSASRSSVLALDFFHSRFGSGRGGDTGGDVLVADPAASSRDLFFPPAVFRAFDGEGFILQVHGVFTRIRSGSLAAARLDLHFLNDGSAHWQWFLARSAGNGYKCVGVKNPKGFGFYL
jgi:hypothetical protein